MGNEGNGRWGRWQRLYWGAESELIHVTHGNGHAGPCNKTPSQTSCVYILPAILEDLVFYFTNISFYLLRVTSSFEWVLVNSLLTPLGRLLKKSVLAFSLFLVLHVISGGMCQM